MNDIAPEVSEWVTHLIDKEIQLHKPAFSDQAEVYFVKTPGKNYVLKLSASLQAEFVNLQKLAPYLSVPEIIGFTKINDRDCLLLSQLPGKNLAELVTEWSPQELVHEFALAVREIHSLPLGELFPGIQHQGHVVLHGDASMPNVICPRLGVRGHIDLGQVRPGEADQDLADAIWSLQRNMGPGYGELFLKEYGQHVLTDKLKKALSFRYTP